MIDAALLTDAVDVLEALATGQPPDEVHALLGAFALSSLSLKPTLPPRDYRMRRA